MNSLAQQVQASLPLQAKRWWLAVSGGLDSMCLLHLVKQMQQNPSVTLPEVHVLHVHHGLQADADRWQAFVAEQSQSYGFPYQCVKVTVDAQLQQQQGLEAAARAARYKVFAETIETNDVVILAQHANDQVETLLLRLLRGAGVAGLGAMRQCRPLGKGHVQRPLLSVSREALVSYAQEHQIQWCEDPSNADEDFDRNYLRHQVMPLLQQRWPDLSKRVATTSHIMQGTQDLLQQVAQADYQQLTSQSPSSEVGLSVTDLLALSIERRHNLLRWWLHQLGEPAPDFLSLHHIDEQVLLAGADRQPCFTLTQGELRRAYGKLYWVDYQQNIMTEEQAEMLQEWVWDASVTGSEPVATTFGFLHPVIGGLKLHTGDCIGITRRQGGERCQPQGRAHSQSLKKLLQEYQIPVWKRDDLPLFWINDRLAMVGDLWICEGFAAAQGELGWRWSTNRELD
jgi:tRNA(Ile)-lysidine synthase